MLNFNFFLCYNIKMSEDKYRKALENCTKDAVSLRKKLGQIEGDLDKAKRALKNCLNDAVSLRKQMRSPMQKVRRSRRGRKSRN
jgi:hypothetical protein